MFRTLVEAIVDALGEGPEGVKLRPFELTRAQIRQTELALRKLRRDAGESEKPDVNTRKKVLFRGV